MCHFKPIIIFFVYEKFINELCGSIIYYRRITNGQILLCNVFWGRVEARQQHKNGRNNNVMYTGVVNSFNDGRSKRGTLLFKRNAQTAGIRLDLFCSTKPRTYCNYITNYIYE